MEVKTEKSNQQMTSAVLNWSPASVKAGASI